MSPSTTRPHARNIPRARDRDDARRRRGRSTTRAMAKTTKIGINGFGRIGRLAFRVAYDDPSLEIVHVNETPGGGASCAYLCEFDSVHGRWSKGLRFDEEKSCLRVSDGREIDFRRAPIPRMRRGRRRGCGRRVGVHGGVFEDEKARERVFRGETRGVVKKVVVSAPVKCEGAVNIVYGVNHEEYDATKHRVLTSGVVHDELHRARHLDDS